MHLAVVKCSNVMVTVSSHNTLLSINAVRMKQRPMILLCTPGTSRMNFKMETQHFKYRFPMFHCPVFRMYVLKNNTKPRLKNVSSESSLSLRARCYSYQLQKLLVTLLQRQHSCGFIQLWVQKCCFAVQFVYGVLEDSVLSNRMICTKYGRKQLWPV